MDLKIVDQNEKVLDTLTKSIRIYNQDRRIPMYILAVGSDRILS